MVTRIRSHWLGYFLLLSISDLVMDIERAVYLDNLPSLLGDPV